MREIAPEVAGACSTEATGDFITDLQATTSIILKTCLKSRKTTGLPNSTEPPEPPCI